MFAKENLYRIWCTTENKWIPVWGLTAPIVCPNNSAHSINSNSVSITEDGKKNNNSEIRFNSGNDVIGVRNLDISKTIRIKSSEEPSNPGSDFGVLFKPASSSDIHWKSGTSDAVNLVKRFGNSIDRFYGAGVYSTSNNNFIRAVTWNTNPITAGYYRIAWSMYCNVNATTSFSLRVMLDDAPIQIFNSRSNTTNSIDNSNYSYFWYDNLAAGSHEIGVDISVSGSRTFRLSNVAIELWQLP